VIAHITIDPRSRGNYFPTLLKYRNVSIGSINESGGAYGWCACGYGRGRVFEIRRQDIIYGTSHITYRRERLQNSI